ncbi:MAG: hypothetical protein WEC15_03290 [Flavobacteriales bacterium]
MRYTLFSALLLISSLGLKAQQDSIVPVRTFKPFVSQSQVLYLDTPQVAVPVAPQREGRIELHVDPRIEQAMADYADRKHSQQGYRVQIFLGDRRTAEETKRSFLLKYPDRAAYLSWLAPNFRLRVGDLRTRLEAERMLRDLKVEYPGSYIVRDEIEPPVLPPLSAPE